MNLYERIEALCKERGINVTEMCRQTEITRAKLSDLKMKRTRSLSAQTLAKIAGYFGVSVDYLLEITPPPFTLRLFPTGIPCGRSGIRPPSYQ